MHLIDFERKFMDNNQQLLDCVEKFGIEFDKKRVGESTNPHFPADMHDKYEVTFRLEDNEATFDFYWPNWKEDTFGVDTALNALLDDAYSLNDYPEFDPDFHNDRESFYDIVETDRKLHNLLGDKYDALMYTD